MTRWLLLTFTVHAILVLGAVKTLTADEPQVIFTEDFSNVKGFSTTNTNSEYVNSDDDGRTRESHSYMSDVPPNNEFVITVKEDNKTEGPDGKPGVLSLSYDKVPDSAEYSGFMYQGRVDEPIVMPGKLENVTEDDLLSVRLSFRYRGHSQAGKTESRTYNCRVEMDIDESYDNRLDFGPMKVYKAWSQFDVTLNIGKNKDRFLKTINALDAPRFKIVWGQDGAIGNYRSGDTLLIDDIKITAQK